MCTLFVVILPLRLFMHATPYFILRVYISHAKAFCVQPFYALHGILRFSSILIRKIILLHVLGGPILLKKTISKQTHKIFSMECTYALLYTRVLIKFDGSAYKIKILLFAIIILNILHVFNILKVHIA